MNVVKFIGAWGCIMASVIMLLLTREVAVAGLPALLALLSISFSQAPTNT